MSNWFWVENGERRGPVSPDDFVAMVGAAQIRPDSMVWQEGLADWVPASSIPGLFAAPAAATSPLPSAAGVAFQSAKQGAASLIPG